jgi:hypothetical protein
LTSVNPTMRLARAWGTARIRYRSATSKYPACASTSLFSMRSFLALANKSSFCILR